MKKLIIALIVSLTTFTANAGWEVKTHMDDMTDEVNGHSVSYVTEQGGLFALNCTFDGYENMMLIGNEYLGISSVGDTVYAVDGVLFVNEPIDKKLRLGRFMTIANFDIQLVASMTNGEELRVKQNAPYQDSSVYKFPLEGFTEAYKEWAQRCSVFY